MKTCRLKKLITAVSTILIFTLIPGTSALSEYIFKKDGSIIRGSIVKDYPESISVKKDDGVTEQVKRNDILRINYTELYLGKVYARLTSGEVVEGYQVDEDRDYYFFRKDILNPEEFKIQRKKVMFIAHTNPTDVKGTPSTVFINMTWSPPFKPAKFYRVFLRNVKSNEETFQKAGETAETAYTLNNLLKSWTYELYATAIADSGEESLPSEKITVNTLPERPENLKLDEELSRDGQTVTLTFRWDNVSDPESRVTGYIIYEIEDGEKRKKGTSSGSEFVIKDYPAEGKHWFSLVAVNDIFTESDEIKVVYDAGYRIYTRGAITYLYPAGAMSDMTSDGYGMMAAGGISWRKYCFGIETGILTFSPASCIKSMMMVPFLFEADYLYHFSLPVPGSFSVRPAVKAGWSYDMIKYDIYDPANPLIKKTGTKNSFDPMISFGAYLKYEFNEKIDFSGGFDFSSLFQRGGRLSFAGIALGAEYIY